MDYKRSGTLISVKYREYFFSITAAAGCMAAASIVDRIMVGNFLSANDLSATSLTVPVITALTLLYNLIFFGGSTLAMTCRGKCDERGANLFFTLTFLIGEGSFLLAAILLVILWDPLTLLLTQGRAELYQPVHDYLFPQFFQSLLVLPANGLVSFSRNDGFKRLALISPFLINAVNLFFDFLFMGVLHFGIMSAAWATVQGYAFGMVFAVYYLRSGKRSFHFCRVRARDLRRIPEILHSGLASGLSVLTMLFRITIMNTLVLHIFGVPGMTAMSVILSVIVLANVLFSGTSGTILPLAGALYGEEDLYGIRSLVTAALRMVLLLGGIAAVLLILFPIPFSNLFGIRSPESYPMIKSALPLFAISIPLDSVVTVFRSHYQAVQQKNTATFLTILEDLILFIPGALLLSRIHPSFLWAVYGAAPLLTLIIMLPVMQLRGRKMGASSFLMLKPSPDTILREFSLPCTKDAPARAAKTVSDYCAAEGLHERQALFLSVAAEELCSNIVKFAAKSKEIDLFVKFFPDKTLLRVRDNGEPFDPTEHYDPAENAMIGLRVLFTLPAEVQYNRVINFNETLVTVCADTA